MEESQFLFLVRFKKKQMLAQLCCFPDDFSAKNDAHVLY